MEIVLRRIRDDHYSTIGELYLDGKLLCFTLEDSFRHKKIVGKTRIPSGKYEIKLREGSPMAAKYESKYGTKGMIWLQDVPNFEYVYIHIGNSPEDTEGCILVGRRGYLDVAKQFIIGSTDAYVSLHPKIIRALDRNEQVTITILDN